MYCFHQVVSTIFKLVVFWRLLQIKVSDCIFILHLLGYKPHHHLNIYLWWNYYKEVSKKIKVRSHYVLWAMKRIESVMAYVKVSNSQSSSPHWSHRFVNMSSQINSFQAKSFLYVYRNEIPMSFFGKDTHMKMDRSVRKTIYYKSFDWIFQLIYI